MPGQVAADDQMLQERLRERGAAVDWVELVLPYCGFAVVLFGPGWLIGRGLGLRGLLGLGVAPALSSASYAVGSVVLARLGVPWSPFPVAVGVMAAAAAALASSTAVRRRWAVGAPAPSAGGWRDRGLWGMSWWWWLTCAVGVSSMIMIVPTVVGMGTPGAPLQQWDAVFHLNGVASILETGVADNVNGLYGADVAVYYPTVWHAMVALTVGLGGPLTTSSIAAAANASTLVMGSLGWLLGLAAFAQACWPRRPGVVVLTVAVGSAFSMFPTVVLSTLAQWPNALSVMLVPGAAALVVMAVRAFSTRTQLAGCGPVMLASCALVSVVGVGAAHGTGVLGVAIVAGPYLVAVCFAALRAAARGPHRQRVLGAVVGAGVLVAVAAYLVLTSPVVAGLLNYPRLPQRSYAVSVPRTLFDTILSPWPGALLITAAVVVGAVVAVRARSGRWLVVSTGIVVVLGALAAGPENPLRVVTGIWYTQAARIEALYPVTASVLAATGLAAASAWLRRRWLVREERTPGRTTAWSTPAIAGALVVLAFVTSGGFQVPQRAVRFAHAYDPSQITWGTMLSADEVELMRNLPSILDEDAVLLGDPFSGAPFAWSIGLRRVVYPQLNTSTVDEARAYLLNHFRDIRTDPTVCEYLDELGVTHFYHDSAGRKEGAKVHPGGAGLREVDTSDGFQVVAVAGRATVFKIDLCD